MLDTGRKINIYTDEAEEKNPKNQSHAIITNSDKQAKISPWKGVLCSTNGVGKKRSPSAEV